MPRLLGGCLPRRRRECGSELQPPVSEGQPPYAAHSQSGCQRRRQGQRKYLRDCVSPSSTAPGTQSNDRGDCPSAVSSHLEDFAPGNPLRGTGPVGERKVEASARCENDSGTPKPWLPGRIIESCQSRLSGMIFDPALRRSLCSRQSTWISLSTFILKYDDLLLLRFLPH